MGCIIVSAGNIVFSLLLLVPWRAAGGRRARIQAGQGHVAKGIAAVGEGCAALHPLLALYFLTAEQRPDSIDPRLLSSVASIVTVVSALLR